MSARPDDGMTLDEARRLVELSRNYSWLNDRQIAALRMVHAHLEVRERELIAMVARRSR